MSKNSVQCVLCCQFKKGTRGLCGGNIVTLVLTKEGTDSQ